MGACVYMYACVYVYACMCVHVCDSTEVTYYEASVSEFKKPRYREVLNSNVKDTALGKLHLAKESFKRGQRGFSCYFLERWGRPTLYRRGSRNHLKQPWSVVR